MVANRKGPSAPAPTMRSSNNASSSLPRSGSKGKQPNNTPSAKPPSSKSASTKKSSTAKTPKKHTPSFLMTLALFTVQLLALYAFLTCPSERHSSTPLCRSVRLYKNNILDPYILPPVYSALSHPAAQPYVEQAHVFQKRVEPFVLKSVQVAQPVAEVLGDITIKTKQILWDGVIVPQFVKLVVPQYQAHLAPHMEQAALMYTSRVAPHVDRVYSIVIRVDSTLRLFLNRVYAIVKPLSERIWLNIKPHLLKLWKLSKPYLLKLWTYILRSLSIFAHQLGDARRQYVDPHIATIWDKAAELSRNGAASSSITQEPSSTSSTSSSSSSLSVATEESTSSSTQSEASATPAASPSSSVEAIPSSSPVEAIPSSSAHSESSTITASSSISSSVEDLSEESTAASHIVDEPSSDNTEESSPSASSPEPTLDDDMPDDLDDLFGDLEPSAVPLSPEEILAQHAARAEENARLQEEAEAEALRKKKEETVYKRRDLMKRHTDWETKLNTYMTESTTRLREGLEAHRMAHLDALIGQYEGDEETTGSIVRSLVDGAARDGEKVLISLEAFLKKAVKAMDSPDFDLPSQLKKWDLALNRVKEKFEGILRATQEGIFQWYSNMRTWEIQQVLEMDQEATRIASEGQTDMGMDYAWLDDVTHKDWSRYHDLINSAKRFGHEIRSIQNGTHPSPPEDPITEAMQSLQLEMEEIIGGFQVAWSNIRTQGIDTFTEPAVEVVEPVESVADPVAAVESVDPIDPVDPVESVEPTSVVPVSPPASTEEGIKKTDPDAFIGRSPEEILEAVERAGGGHVEHVEL